MSHLRFITKELINKGWSNDIEYCVTSEDGMKYLLRITPNGKIADCEAMFKLL